MKIFSSVFPIACTFVGLFPGVRHLAGQTRIDYLLLRLEIYPHAAGTRPRVTNLYRTSTVSPVIRHLSVVATARVGQDILRLEIYCGDLWQMGTQESERDQRIRETVERLHQTLQAGCYRLGLEVRAGILEEHA